MPVYEFDLVGFDASTSDTDHLIKWVKASDLHMAAIAVHDKWGAYQAAGELFGRSNYGFKDGVDLVITSKGELRYAKLKEQIKAPS